MEENRKVSIVDESKNVFDIFYSVVGDKGSYGIEVLLVKEDVRVDKDCVIGLTEKKEYAVEVMDRLAENSVTPTTLMEVISDML